MFKIAVIAALLLVMLAMYRFGRSRYNVVRRRRREILDRLRHQDEEQR